MEKFKESFYIALASLAANPIRSILSIMGVVIGIAAVITILSIGLGVKKKILERINTLGANSFYVYGRYDEKTGRMGQFDLNDISKLNELPFVESVRPDLRVYTDIHSRGGNGRGNVIGIDSLYLPVQDLKMYQGREFSPIELENRSLVCLINEGAQSQLFPEGDLLGKTLYFGETPCEVVGVYGPIVKPSIPMADMPKDIEVLTPYATLIRNMKETTIQSIEVRVKKESAKTAADDLRLAMERDDPQRKDLFIIRDQKEYYAKSLEIQTLLSLIGSIVAGISLIVGGIGMMNVMLTSVAERTREIGIRRAVGARRKDILFQFLIESCVLSASGGILGLLIGAALARGLPLVFRNFFDISPRLQPSFLLLAVGVGVTLGVVFGFYPAVKASKLVPSEALRSE